MRIGSFDTFIVCSSWKYYQCVANSYFPYLRITERSNICSNCLFFSLFHHDFWFRFFLLTLLSLMVKVLQYTVDFKVSAYSQELKYPTEVLDALALSLKETAQLCSLESMETVCYHCSHIVRRQSLMTSSKRLYSICILFQVLSESYQS